jgi:hypothetical protein
MPPVAQVEQQPSVLWWLFSDLRVMDCLTEVGKWRHGDGVADCIDCHVTLLCLLFAVTPRRTRRYILIYADGNTTIELFLQNYRWNIDLVS